MYFNFIHVQGVVTMQSWSVRFDACSHAVLISLYKDAVLISLYKDTVLISLYKDTVLISLYKDTVFHVYTRIQFIQGCSPTVYTRDTVYTRIQSWSVYTRIQSWSVYTRIQSWSVYTRIQLLIIMASNSIVFSWAISIDESCSLVHDKCFLLLSQGKYRPKLGRSDINYVEVLSGGSNFSVFYWRQSAGSYTCRWYLPQCVGNRCYKLDSKLLGISIQHKITFTSVNKMHCIVAMK